jgi:GH15 family glucan-1,4-alpha-glucosidase
MEDLASLPAPIEDYALIGGGATGALVARRGTIDWLCLPRFDSGACFAALLGTAENGRWLLAPNGQVNRIERRYVEDTLILETTYSGPDGVVTVIDGMPGGTYARGVVRIVSGQSGAVPMCMDLRIRFDYGSIIPWVRRIDGGISALAGPDALELRTPVPLHGENFRTVAQFTVRAGERVPFVLTWYPSHLPSPPPLDAEQVLAKTVERWRRWVERCTYQGPFREAVVRSLITLKALTYPETGGIVAAPTSSLPEALGGNRNWDYRYCWLRDATYTLYALLMAGYSDEARAFREWLLRAVAGKPSELQIMYGVAGERRLTEQSLPWLRGYHGARPVRLGNAACEQFQLDVYGEVMDLMHQSHRLYLGGDEAGWRLQRALVEFLEHSWQLPDEGIWEVRGGRRHFTHSKIMAWVAIDRAIRSVEEFHLPGEADLARWRHLRSLIHSEVCTRGYSVRLGAFVQSFDSEELDASLLMVPLVGFLPAEDPRVMGTVAAISRSLVYEGLVRRYASEPRPGSDRPIDGLPPGEGVFLLCSFWMADNLLLLGRHEEALALYQRLLGLRNDVGLLSEEYDPVSRHLLGNFPQAYSHVAIVNTAHNMSARVGPAEHRAS